MTLAELITTITDWPNQPDAVVRLLRQAEVQLQTQGGIYFNGQLTPIQVRQLVLAAMDLPPDPPP